MTNIEETEDINLNDVENEDESTNEQDVDSLKAELAKERAEREKFEARFKRTAKQLNEFKSKAKVDLDPEELFEKKFNEKMFFMNNPTAKEFEKEIKDVQDSSNLGIEDAYTLFLARKQSLEANKTSPWVDWVDQEIKPKKSFDEMTEEELWAYKG